jgi:lipopolysaccharide export system permease protein
MPEGSGRKIGNSWMPILIFDRYLFSSFCRVFLICLISFAGLFIVIDVFSNLDEVLSLSGRNSFSKVLLSYYGPRCLQFFDRMAPFLALIASVFCIARMQRSSELTAIQAAGISNRRIVRPLLIATLLVLIVSVINRELVIPRHKETLIMNAQDLAEGKGRVPSMVVDRTTGLIIRGQEVMPARQSITMPGFQVPADWKVPGNRISGDNGVWVKATEDHPAGYLINNSPAAELDDNTGPPGGEPVVLVPARCQWLRPGQVFVACEIDTIRLAFSSQMVRNASLAGMISDYRNSTGSNSSRLRVDIHARIVQPLFDMAILLVGLPLVMARSSKNMFLSAGMCILLATAMSLFLIASHSMGVSRMIPSPVLAAWLPVLVFLPFGWVALGKLGKA